MAFNKDKRTVVQWAQRVTILGIVIGLFLSLSVFQNCSKKGTANTGNTTAGYTPRKVTLAESFGFGARGAPSVSVVRTAGRLVPAGLSQGNDQIFIGGTVENAEGKDAAILRFSASGELKSATVINSDGQEELRGQAVDAQGRLIAVGSSRRTIDSGYDRSGLLLVDDNGRMSSKLISAGVVTSLSASAAGADTVVVGFTSDSVRSEVKSPLIVSLDKNHQVLWSNRLGGVESGEFLAVTQLPNEIIAVGYRGQASALIARFTLGGQLVGVKGLRLGESTQALAAASAGDGGVLVAGAVGNRGVEHGFVAKLSASGSLEWVSISEGEGRFQAVSLNQAGQIVVAGSMLNDSGTRNVLTYRLSAGGLSIGQSLLGGQQSSFLGGQSLIGGESGSRVALSTTGTDGSLTSMTLVRLDQDFSDCEFVRASSAGLVSGRGSLVELSSRLVGVSVQLSELSAQPQDLNVSGAGLCY